MVDLKNDFKKVDKKLIILMQILSPKMLLCSSLGIWNGSIFIWLNLSWLNILHWLTKTSRKYRKSSSFDTFYQIKRKGRVGSPLKSSEYLIKKIILCLFLVWKLETNRQGKRLTCIFFGITRFCELYRLNICH